MRLNIDVDVVQTPLPEGLPINLITSPYDLWSEVVFRLHSFNTP